MIKLVFTTSKSVVYELSTGLLNLNKFMVSKAKVGTLDAKRVMYYHFNSFDEAVKWLADENVFFSEGRYSHEESDQGRDAYTLLFRGKVRS